MTLNNLREKFEAFKEALNNITMREIIDNPDIMTELTRMGVFLNDFVSVIRVKKSKSIFIKDGN